MSHEIRTPMNAIIGLTRLAIDSRPEQEMRSHLEIISNSSQLLMTLLNDILDISQIEAGELVITNDPFEFHTTVKSCITMIRQLMEETDRELKLT